MVKIYGSSDAETSFLELVNGSLKDLEFSSLDHFNEFKKNPSKYKLELIKEIETEISSLKEEISFLKNENSRSYDKLKRISIDLRYRFSSMKGKYGPLRENIQSEINSLKSKQKNLQSLIEKNKDKVSNFEIRLKNLKYTKLKEIEVNFSHNEKEVNRISKDNSLLKLMAGAHGENSVIKFIEDQFSNEKNTYLINSFDLDIEEKAIHIQDRTLKISKVDHIFVSSKGIFLIETKAWSHITTELTKSVENQLKRYEKVFSEKFDSIINNNLIYLVVYTKKQIKISNKYKVICLDKLEDFIMRKDDILTKDDITSIMNIFLNDIKDISKFEKITWKGKKAILSFKGLFKKK